MIGRRSSRSCARPARNNFRRFDWREAAMKFRILCAVLPILFVAACGKGDAGGNSSGSAPAGAPVAAAQTPAGQNWVDVVSKTPEGGYVMGNPNAPVKLIEYGSR